MRSRVGASDKPTTPTGAVPEAKPSATRKRGKGVDSSRIDRFEDRVQALYEETVNESVPDALLKFLDAADKKH